MTFARLQTRLEAMTGFQKYALAFLAGALSSLAMPPAGFFPVLLLTAPTLIWLTRLSQSRWKSFATGWAFGAGFFIFSLYWVSIALFVDIQTWGWVLPLSTILGPSLLGVFYGFIPLLSRPWRKNETTYALAFITAWGVVEYARGHLLTGFPWNVAGYAWDHVLPVMQAAAVTGIYGLTLLTVFWAALPAYRSDKKIVIFSSALFLAVFCGGALRLSLHPTETSGHNVRIVQAAIPQDVKWNDDAEWRNFEKHLKLTKAATALEKPPAFVIWPETSVNADLSLFPEVAKLIAMNLPPGTTGILGNLRITSDKDGMRFYNSVTALTDKAEVVGVYDKHHLVPFGEYIPFRDHLNLTPIGLAISNIGDFSKGPGPVTIKTGDLPSFSPLICYEVIFPGAVTDRNNRPDWLVNATNDGWYGQSAGPYQHMAIARLRSVEEGLPLVRSANTGISAVVDPLGRIIARIPLGMADFADSFLPAPLPPTLYARFGDMIFFIMLLLSAGLVFAYGRKN